MAKVKIKLKGVDVPEYQSENAACVDVSSAEDITVRPNRHEFVRTGMSVELPEGTAMLLFPRSSLGLSGLIMTNSVGVIDADYRGEILISLYNTGYKSVDIKAGQRIAQAMLVKPCKIEFVPVESLTVTARGDGGFGSTGK